MNKKLIELQKGASAVCAVVLQEEYKKLSPIVSMSASVSDKFLYSSTIPPFARSIDTQAKKYDTCYFVIKNFDAASQEQQLRFLPIIKDRMFYNYNLPDNCIIVLAVTNSSAVAKICKQIHQLSIMCI